MGAPSLFRCRSCGAGHSHPFLDLGILPLANRLPTDPSLPEPRYPLVAVVCGACRLVQLTHDVPPDAIFSDYPYFSSYSSSWVEHARRYAVAAANRLGLDRTSLVVEAASNDGYLLRHFSDLGIPVLGIEPADTVAAAARAAGIPTDGRFFGMQTARSLRDSGLAADLIVANNVLAHVPDLNDFLAGVAILLKPGGTFTCEVPHLLRLMQGVQFDTIYHEHFSYFSLLALEHALTGHGLAVFDIEELSTHGGSLRLWIRPAPVATTAAALRHVRAEEQAAGLDADEAYDAFGAMAGRCLVSLRRFLADAAAAGRRVAAYGAAAKGATLLGACGAGVQDIAFVADLNPHKQGRYLPGTGIPIVEPGRIFAERPDYVLILPWNLRDEIVMQLAGIRDWGGRFVVPVPETVVLS